MLARLTCASVRTRLAKDCLTRARRIFDLLADDPHDAAVREHRFHEGLWGVRLRDRYENWIILWQEGAIAGDDVVVRYLGPDTLT